MKRIIAFVLICICMSFQTGAKAVSAKGACVLDQNSKTIIYSKNANNRMEMASTTKIMTALIAIERLDLDKIVTVSKNAAGVEGSSIYLAEGEKISVRSLLYGLMLNSGNDAAIALSEAVSKTTEDFCALMNQKAKEIGLTQTHFINPSGLPDKNHYTTPYELAVLAAVAMENETFRQIVGQTSYRAEDGNYIRMFSNHNKMLKYYKYTTGIKTGFTKSAGRCLVTSAKKDMSELICVTLSAPDDWADHKVLLDYGFSKMDVKTLCEALEYEFDIPVINGEQASVSIRNSDELKRAVPQGFDVEVKINIPKFVYAPVGEGDVIGEVCFFCNDEKISSVDLLSVMNINMIKNEKTFIQNVIENFKGFFSNLL